jgi:hypothetical protein
MKMVAKPPLAVLKMLKNWELIVNLRLCYAVREILNFEIMLWGRAWCAPGFDVEGPTRWSALTGWQML